VIPLQKWLQARGVASKREVRRLIRDGAVTLNGVVESRYAEPVGADDVVTIDGQLVELEAPRTLLLMNKPPKHLTVIDDQPDGPGLGRYLPEGIPRVFPVGRLDFNTEGALLWTNDGLLGRRVLHPDYALPKRYGVKIRGHLDAGDPGFERIRSGMRIGGVTYRPAGVRLGEYRTRATWVHLTLTEGKHREIRRMCRACGYQIVKLRREAIGPLELGDLNKRCVRALSDDEIAALDAAVLKSLQ